MQYDVPGVYVHEVNTEPAITGVSTSVTAFIGRAVAGQVNVPILITSFADYQRFFGGLGVEFPMSYAVLQFFDNGGDTAVVVRLVSGTEVKTAVVDASVGLPLEAWSVGAWGNGLAVHIDYNEIKDKNLFNLTVRYTATGETPQYERFVNLTVTGDGENRVDKVLLTKSQYVRLQQNEGGQPLLPSSRPAEMRKDVFASFSGGVNGGYLQATDYLGDEKAKTGLYALNEWQYKFNILCIPPDQRNGKNSLASDLYKIVYPAALAYCYTYEAMLIVDPPDEWETYARSGEWDKIQIADLTGMTAIEGRNGAIYFPRLLAPDPFQVSKIAPFAPSGAMAGIWAANDNSHGVWKAPAGMPTGIVGVTGFAVALNDTQNGLLNDQGINCLRYFDVAGPVVWGARTLRGATPLNDEFQYISVRRLTLYIENSVKEGIQWAVFEANDQVLWQKLEKQVTAFMADLQKQGAMYEYKVSCNATTTTPTDVLDGWVNLQIMFAPLRPSEFIVLMIKQQVNVG